MTKKTQKAEHYTSELLDSLMAEIKPLDQARTNQRMLLAAKIDDARKKKGLSKGDFASQMGKKPSEISRWLSGTHNFTSDTLSDIQEVLGVKLLNTEANDASEVIVQYNLFVSGNEILSTENVISLYDNSIPCISLRGEC